MKQAALSIIRHLLGIGGSYLIGKGVFSEASVLEMVSGIVAFAGLVWGAWDEYRASKASKIIE